MKQNRNSVSSRGNAARNSYVIGQITSTCFQLLKSTSLAKISVSELCTAAQTGRASFYRNFASKVEIVQKWIAQDLSDWMANWKDNPLPERQVLDLFEHLYQKRDLYLLIYQRGLLYLFKNYLTSSFQLDTHSDAVQAYSASYVIAVIYGWIETWLSRSMKESPQDLAVMFHEAFQNSPKK